MARKPTWPSTYIEDLSPRETRNLIDVLRSYVPEKTRSWGWILFGLVLWLAALAVIVALVLFR
jgi:hypothetical protein